MKIVLTKKEIIASLEKEVEILRRENKELKLIISKNHGKSYCTCGIRTKECIPANDWINCPVHGFYTEKFEKGGEV